MLRAVLNVRRAVRVRTPYRAMALDRAAGATRLVTLENISTGGAFLHGANARLGTHLRIALLCDDPPPVVDVRVVRQDDGGSGEGGIGVAFEHLAPMTRGAIERVVMRQLGYQVQAMQAGALVVDASSYVRRYICEALEAFGAQTAAATAPLETLQALEQRSTRLGVVYVGRPHGSASGDELALHLASHHPELRVVLIVGVSQGPAWREELAAAGIALEVVEKPWSPLLLAGYLLPSRRLPAVRARLIRR